jgi:hypothetical protein
LQARRGRITAVLALDAAPAIPAELVFLPPLAFAVILLTNFLVLLAAIGWKERTLEARQSEIATRPTRAAPVRPW